MIALRRPASRFVSPWIGGSMNGNVSKVIAATAAASLACEVPLPALVDEVVVASPRDLGTDAFAEEPGRVLGREVATDPADLFPVITHEAYLPETHDPEAPQAPRRPQREYPR
ncbi:UNVERIFIED_ORG: putative beta-ketoacyl synthase [Clostridioides difficile F501]